MNYWIVSPNLGASGEKDLDAWCRIVLKHKAAFMETIKKQGLEFLKRLESCLLNNKINGLYI